MLWRPTRVSVASTLTPNPTGWSRARRRATTAVEFAVVAPIYLTIVLGIIEVGRGLMVTMLLFNAARIGARVGTVEGTSPQDIQNAVNNYLSSMGINTDQVSVQVNDAPATNQQDPNFAPAGAEVTVVVTIPASQVTWVPGVQLAGFLSNSSGRDTMLLGQFTLRRE